MNKKTWIILFFITFFVGDVCLANPLKQKFEEATVAFTQGKYKQAIALYEESVKMYPKLAPAYFFMGLSHREIGTDTDKITWLFEKTVELDPNHAKAHEHLGKIYYERGKFEKAEEHSLKALQLDPNNISAQLSLGWIYLLGRSNPSQAIVYFEDVLQKHNVPYAYLGLGMAYYMTDERAKVLDMITHLRQVDQEHLAEQLEAMVRQRRHAPTIQQGVPLFTQKQPKSALIRDVPPTNYPTITGNTSVEKMPVRLSGKLPSGNAVTEDTTGADRIRALQRRTQHYSKGSGY